MYPYASNMVMDFGLTEDRSAIGYYAGFLCGGVMLGRALGASFWGYAANRYGRKPVLVSLYTRDASLSAVQRHVLLLSRLGLWTNRRGFSIRGLFVHPERTGITSFRLFMCFRTCYPI